MDMKRHLFISFLIFMSVDKGKKKWNNYKMEVVIKKKVKIYH
jgi:hypothetical protein